MFRSIAFALGATVTTTLLVGAALATEYDELSYYRQAAQPSPSDLPVAPPTDAATATDTGCDAYGCDSGCDAGGGCDSGCDSCDCCGGFSLFPCNNCGDPRRLLPETCCGLSVTGWLQAGYTNKSTGLFNSHPDKLNLHQAYLVFEKAASSDSCCWDWGFRADAVYGTDAQDTQAFGNNPGTWDYLNGFDHGIYGWAMPQLYAEIARSDLNIKVGHFYTLHGYEVVTAPDNFFFSHSFTMYNSEPFTHTGALATYSWSDNLDIYAGWTLGWDTGFDQFDDGNNLIAGFSYDLRSCDASFTYVFSVGDFGARGDDGFHHSVVFDANLTERLEYVFQHDYTRTDTPGDLQYGINQYLFYELSDCWKVGGRVEWWKAAAVSNYEITGGLNYKPVANFVVRPEIRHQWTPAANVDETIFGIDAIVLF